MTFLQAVSSELAMNGIDFNNLDQHVRYLAHVINLAAQEVLKSLKTISNISNNEFLDERDNNNEQAEVTDLLYKVNNSLINK